MASLVRSLCSSHDPANVAALARFTKAQAAGTDRPPSEAIADESLTVTDDNDSDIDMGSGKPAAGASRVLSDPYGWPGSAAVGVSGPPLDGRRTTPRSQSAKSHAGTAASQPRRSAVAFAAIPRRSARPAAGGVASRRHSALSCSAVPPPPTGRPPGPRAGAHFAIPASAPAAPGQASIRLWPGAHRIALPHAGGAGAAQRGSASDNEVGGLPGRALGGCRGKRGARYSARLRRPRPAACWPCSCRGLCAVGPQPPHRAGRRARGERALGRGRHALRVTPAARRRGAACQPNTLRTHSLCARAQAGISRWGCHNCCLPRRYACDRPPHNHRAAPRVAACHSAPLSRHVPHRQEVTRRPRVGRAGVTCHTEVRRCAFCRSLRRASRLWGMWCSTGRNLCCLKWCFGSLAPRWLMLLWTMLSWNVNGVHGVYRVVLRPRSGPYALPACSSRIWGACLLPTPS